MAVRGGMTKAELVDQVAKRTQMTKKHAEIMVNTVFDSIVDSLKAGEKIELRGFGSFRIRHSVHHMAAKQTIALLIYPKAKLSHETCSCKNGVETAPTHQFLKP